MNDNLINSGHFTEHQKKEKKIVINIHKYQEEIRQIKEDINNKFNGIEDMFYRFYHHSYKVYDLQKITIKMVDLFCIIGECKFRDLNEQFLNIVSEGIDKAFSHSHNLRWNYETRPILEGFFHSRHLLLMMEKYGLQIDPDKELPMVLSQGWASVLYLYNIR